MISNNIAMMDGGNSKKVEYELYENLNDFEENEDIDNFCYELIKNIADESDWAKQFEAVNNLRRLNKFIPDLSYKVLENVILNISKLTASIRSNLSKLTLMLIKEIFCGENFRNSKILKLLLSSALTQSASMKSFIKSESNLCLENISKNVNFFDLATVESLIEEISNKNLQISENAFNTVTKLISNWDDDEIKFIDSKWKVVVQQLISLYSLKREPYAKRACRIAELITSKLGKEIHSIFCDSKVDTNSQNMINVMMKAAESSKKNTKPSSSIKDFIKSNKDYK